MHDQIMFCAFQSFLVEIQTNAAYIHVICMHNNNLAPVVQTLDSTIQRINHYPADNAIVSRNTYPLDSDLSGG